MELGINVDSGSEQRGVLFKYKAVNVIHDLIPTNRDKLWNPAPLESCLRLPPFFDP